MSKYGCGFGDGELEPQIATLDRVSTDASRITIVSRTGEWNVTRNWTEPYESTGHTTQRKATQVNITECAFHDVTYHVDFTFQYPGQALEFSASDWSNNIAASTIPEGVYDASISYLTVMHLGGKTLVGRSTWNHYGGEFDYLTAWKMMDIDWTHGERVIAGLEQFFQNMTLSLLSDSGLM